MRPLAAMPAEARRAVRGVLADIDDTITTHGELTPAAYAALARLRDAGKLVIPITGRPAGWSANCRGCGWARQRTTNGKTTRVSTGPMPPVAA